MSILMTDLERAAWERRTDSDKHPPRMACLAAADAITRGLAAKHVIVVVVEDVDGGDRVTYFQAGDLSELAVEGALQRAIRLQSEG